MREDEKTKREYEKAMPEDEEQKISLFLL